MCTVYRTIGNPQRPGSTPTSYERLQDCLAMHLSLCTLNAFYSRSNFLPLHAEFDEEGGARERLLSHTFTPKPHSKDAEDADIETTRVKSMTKYGEDIKPRRILLSYPGLKKSMKKSRIISWTATAIVQS